MATIVQIRRPWQSGAGVARSYSRNCRFDRQLARRERARRQRQQESRVRGGRVTHEALHSAAARSSPFGARDLCRPARYQARHLESPRLCRRRDCEPYRGNSRSPSSVPADASRAIPKPVQPDQVESVFVRREPTVERIQNHAAAALEHGIHRPTSGKRRSSGTLRRETAGHGVERDHAEDTREDAEEHRWPRRCGGLLPIFLPGARLGSP